MSDAETRDSVGVGTSSPIDGGTIDSFEVPDVVQGLKHYEVEHRRHRAQAAKTLAIIFAIILASSFLIHYVAVVVLTLAQRDQALSSVDHAFDAWLPAIASIVSASATYYFTRER